MPLLVTLHVYSQNPDPTWILSDEQSKELIERSWSLPDRTPLKARALSSRLGYRGFSVRSVPRQHLGEVRFTINDGIVDVAREELSYFDRDRQLESWLFNTAPESTVEDLREHVQEALTLSAETKIRELTDSIIVHPQTEACISKASDAPIFNERKWSLGMNKTNNNCYNYANDQVLLAFCRPGLAHGSPFMNSCPDAKLAAMADGLKPTDDFSRKLEEGDGWYVALAVWPGRDSHWYRQDVDGCWSQKLGQDQVTRLDNSKNFIQDPQLCDRKPYTDFCTYMITKKYLTIA